MTRSYPKFCHAAGGQSEKDADGDRHTHVCGEWKGHTGKHRCEYCGDTW